MQSKETALDLLTPLLGMYFILEFFESKEDSEAFDMYNKDTSVATKEMFKEFYHFIGSKQNPQHWINQFLNAAGEYTYVTAKIAANPTLSNLWVNIDELNKATQEIVKIDDITNRYLYLANSVLMLQNFVSSDSYYSRLGQSAIQESSHIYAETIAELVDTAREDAAKKLHQESPAVKSNKMQIANTFLYNSIDLDSHVTLMNLHRLGPFANPNSDTRTYHANNHLLKLRKKQKIFENTRDSIFAEISISKQQLSTKVECIEALSYWIRSEERYRRLFPTMDRVEYIVNAAMATGMKPKEVTKGEKYQKFSQLVEVETEFICDKLF